MTFNAGDRVRIKNYGSSTPENTDLTEPNCIVGAVGTVVESAKSNYIGVIRDNDPRKENTNCLESELELIEDDDEDVDATMEYGIRTREYGGSFEFFHKATGKVLLVTEFVSLDTLLCLAQDHIDANA